MGEERDWHRTNRSPPLPLAPQPVQQRQRADAGLEPPGVEQRLGLAAREHAHDDALAGLGLGRADVLAVARQEEVRIMRADAVRRVEAGQPLEAARRIPGLLAHLAPRALL